MKVATLGRLAGALTLALGLAGCIDMTMDVNVTSETTAVATVTQTRGADIYAMVKSAGDDASDDDKFCVDANQTLTENADGSATCMSVSEGAFDSLDFGDDEDEGNTPTFTPAGPGLVRVALKTEGMMGDLGADDDAQTAAMMKQLFEGHYLTIRFGGAEVTDTNMTLSDDHATAEIKIPFTGLLDGTAELPDELYAVVRSN
jgi:hypothetical protein